MTQEERTDFAKLIVKSVRDIAIQSMNIPLYGDNLKSPTIRRWRKVEDEKDMKAFAEMVIADTVDNTIFYFLEAIDNGHFNISYKSPDGEVIPVTGDIIGELAGWYMGDWVSAYSKERYFDDFPDL